MTKHPTEIAIFGNRTYAAIIGWTINGESETQSIGWHSDKDGHESAYLDSQTEALFRACQVLSNKGFTGKTNVHIQVNNMGLVAECSIALPCYFGDLKFEVAPVRTVSVEEVVRLSKDFGPRGPSA